MSKVKNEMKIKITNSCKCGGKTVYPNSVLTVPIGTGLALINTKKAVEVPAEAKEVTVAREEYAEEQAILALEKEMAQEERKESLKKKLEEKRKNKNKKD